MAPRYIPQCAEDFIGSTREYARLLQVPTNHAVLPFLISCVPNPQPSPLMNAIAYGRFSDNKQDMERQACMFAEYTILGLAG